VKLHILLPSLIRGGCDEYVSKIAKGAIQAGHEVVISFPLLQQDAYLKHVFIKLGAIYRRLKISKSEVEGGSSPKEQLVQGFSLLHETQPDAVLLVLPWPTNGIGFILACASLSLPTVAVFQLCNKTVQIEEGYRKACVRAQQQQVWIAVSQDNRQYLAQTFGISREQIEVVFNGTEPELQWSSLSLQDRKTVSINIKQELKLLASTQLALTVGRLTAQKGYINLLAAIQRLPSRYSGVHFLWAGTGEDEEQLVNAIQSAGLADRIHLLGFRHDVPRLLVASDLFIFPSLWEGASFALLEAMAYRSPIIASNASSNCELIEDGKHGVIYPAGDKEALTKAITWALDNPSLLQKMAQASQERYRSTFNASTMVERTLQLLAYQCV